MRVLNVTEVNSQTQRRPTGFPGPALQVKKDLNELPAEEGRGLRQAPEEDVLVQREPGAQHQGPSPRSACGPAHPRIQLRPS